MTLPDGRTAKVRCGRKVVKLGFDFCGLFGTKRPRVPSAKQLRREKRKVGNWDLLFLTVTNNCQAELAVLEVDESGHRRMMTRSQASLREMGLPYGDALPFCLRCKYTGHSAQNCADPNQGLLCIWCGFRGHVQQACLLAPRLMQPFVVSMR